MLTKIILLIVVIATSLGAGVYFGNKMKGSEIGPVSVVALDEPVVMRTKGGLLEVSTVTASEDFETTKDHDIGWFVLGKTAARIRVPATYRYHIALDSEWRFIRRDKTFVVISPSVKPSLPVAIDTAKVEGWSSGKWSFLTGDAVVEALQKTITVTLGQRASSQKYIDLQREYARKTIAEFVEKWVLSQDKWKTSSGYKVRVFFADEPVEKIQSSGYFPVPLTTTPH